MKTRLTLLIVCLVTAAWAAHSSGVSPRDVVPMLVEWMRGSGGGGVLLFFAAYLICGLCLVPLLPLNTAAGFLWGPAMGLAVVVPANILAAMATFTMGRNLCRAWISQRIEASPRLCAIDRAVRCSGLRFTCLLKLSPVCPFAILNYALGATRMRTRDFLLASMLGAVPGTILYVWIGSLLGEFGAQNAAPAQWHGAAVAGLVPMTAGIVVLARAARRELRRQAEAGA